jgi:hypothetical protein
MQKMYYKHVSYTIYKYIFCYGMFLISYFGYFFCNTYNPSSPEVF